MNKYLKLLSRIYHTAMFKPDRTGTGTYSEFGHQVRYKVKPAAYTNTSELNFYPLALTTKKIHLKSVIHELLWFISGDTNSKTLENKGVRIWKEWSDPDTGDLGPVYGAQWRGLGRCKVDQIQALHDQIRENPYSRRLIVDSWDVDDLDKMVLPPCHMMFQVYIAANGVMDLQVYQRSADMFLGVPFNILQYSILLGMLCAIHGYQPGRLIHTIGDAHIYVNHTDQVLEQLSRKPYKQEDRVVLTLPTGKKSLMEFTYEDFKFSEYKAHPSIKAPVAI